jgi:anti-sigma28 factor (negative regulator of flagellin synthesis)
MKEQEPSALRDERQPALRKRADTEARKARLADLRQRYVDGTYNLDPVELSAKIVDWHLSR